MCHLDDLFPRPKVVPSEGRRGYSVVPSTYAIKPSEIGPQFESENPPALYLAVCSQ